MVILGLNEIADWNVVKMLPKMASTTATAVSAPSPDQSDVSAVIGATLTLTANSNPVTPLSMPWINAHISTHVPLEYHLWSSPPLPQLSPNKTPNSSTSFHFDEFDDNFDEVNKEKYLRYFNNFLIN